MKISIITATYNSAATVGDTLESVRSQSYAPIEHLIIDGLSSDSTLDIVKQYKHVHPVVSAKDKGIYDAMNKGISLASGDIIGILNSDDVYYNNKVINRVMSAFEDETVSVVYGDLQYVRQDDLTRITRTWISGKFRRSNFYFGWMPPHPTFFVRKKVYDEIGAFEISLRSAADYEFMLRVLFKNNYKPFYIPQIFVKMRTGGMSNASIKHRLRANLEDRKAWRINGIKPFFFTLLLKPVRKIIQFIRR